ncbi:MAG: hypothetical protein M3R04_07695, partial [bacterium]|nr:hypothetical protein [bacterium]
MNEYLLESILASIEVPFTLQGDTAGKYIESIRTIAAADATSLAWIDPARGDRQQLLDATKAAAVISDGSLTLAPHQHAATVLIAVAQPKLAIIRIAEKFFA